jgi:hypothetical protein
LAGQPARPLAAWSARCAAPCGPSAAALAAAAAMMAVYGLWQVFRWGGREH